MSKLVIVESPTKARTISKFLDKKNYTIEASYGHIRDLPSNAKEVPLKVKKEKWATLGVNIEKNFEPLYIIPQKKKKRIKELSEKIKKASELLLATDEDREGESISWHLVEVLKPKIPIKRMVFHEITKKAIADALANPRDIDLNLVKAQETRRILDRLFGYTISPLLWKKMTRGLSAGRVQTVALRLLVQREKERMAFKSAEYWDLKGKFNKQNNADIPFEAQLVSYKRKRIASGSHFDPTSGKLKPNKDVVLLQEKEAKEIKETIQNIEAKVVNVLEKKLSSKPYPPFTTSTLQQEANRKLKLTAKHTMQIAQKLYENGFITYMRTDSTILSEEGLSGARTLIKNIFGDEYLPKSARTYQTKVKNAQEAHEAIRPAGENFTDPLKVKKSLGVEAYKLYDLIWKRTLASQMKDSIAKKVTVEIELGDCLFKAEGKTIIFPGYLRAYVEGSDDPNAEIADQEKLLPPIAKGDLLETQSIDAIMHQTKSPPRYTEGSLIKEMERLGIGRPSTWATIVDIVLNRKYAFKKASALVPTFLALAVIRLMEENFNSFVDFKFTASMEDDLDLIAIGKKDSLTYLKSFYFGNGHPGLKPMVEKGEKEIDPRKVCGIEIGKTKDGKVIEVRIGRYGPFVTDGEISASLPDQVPPDEFGIEKAISLLELSAKGPEPLGKDPKSGLPIYIKSGRYGPYIQLGDIDNNNSDNKPKMVSLLPNMKPETVTLEQAIKLLELPKVIGKHSQTGEDIIVANGRFGPYITCGKENRSVPDDIDPLNITLKEAEEILTQPKRRGRRTTAKTTLKELGIHPVTEKKILLKDGRFGPYVTDGKINASIPKGVDINSITLEDAINLIEARIVKLAEKEEA